MTRECCKCHKIKAILEFEGYRKKCKVCRCEESRQRYRNNPEPVKICNKKWREKNRDKVRASNKKWNDAHKEHIRAYCRAKYGDKERKYNREYNKRSYVRERLRIYRQKRLQNPHERILSRLRSRLRVALKAKNASKSANTRELLGCSIEEFKNYLVKLFKPDMTWEALMDAEIHIDHIIPCVAFDLTKPEEQRKCFHYTNLQPLWATDNLKKKDKILINQPMAEKEKLIDEASKKV